MSTAARRFAVVLCMLAAALTAVAAAHPLGNFTINHLAKIAGDKGVLHVRYVLDIAEIPTFQIMHARGDSWTRQAMRQWAAGEVSAVGDGLRITADGQPLLLEPRSFRAALRTGAGGLPILRWVGTFSVGITRGIAHRIAVRDNVYGDRRIGWKDIIVGTQTEPTNELRRYPSALIGTPRRINAAEFVLDPSGRISHVQEHTDDAAPSGTLTAWVSPAALSDMFARRDRTPILVLLTVLAAFALGALHALEPGHGKALLAFTLVGARATTKQALILAGSLTVAHTAGVLLLGAVLFAAADFVSESVYPWIAFISGAAIAVIGARSLASFVRSRHAHAHPHAHSVANTGTLNFRSAIAAAMSGGIAPCPAAIVLLLTALRLHELGYGVVLIAIFSMGLAAVLSGLGIAVVRGAAWLSKRSGYGRVSAYGPLLTAAVISTIGAWSVATAMVQEGAASQAPPIALAVLAAIAAYALTQRTHQHAHSEGHAA